MAEYLEIHINSMERGNTDVIPAIIEYESVC